MTKRNKRIIVISAAPLLLVFLIFIGACSLLDELRVYNDGTAWRLPKVEKVSDWYYDLSNAYEYQGRNQEYYSKITAFDYKDEKLNIHSVFFFAKRIYNEKADFDYIFQLRRYREISEYDKYNAGGKITPIVRYLEIIIDDSEVLTFVSDFPKIWTLNDGVYERYQWRISHFEKEFDTLIEKLTNAKSLTITFPEFDNLYGFPMSKEPFYEFPERVIKIEGTELEIIRNGIRETNAIQRKSNKDYIDYALKTLLY